MIQQQLCAYRQRRGVHGVSLEAVHFKAKLYKTIGERDEHAIYRVTDYRANCLEYFLLPDMGYDLDQSIT